MKKNFLFTLFLFVAVGLTACFDKKEKIYDGPLQVEFPLAARTVTVGAATKVDSIKIQMIGAHQLQNLEGAFSVVTEGTTAVEGTDYTFATPGKFTVPANSSFGYIVINVPATSRASVLKLELKDSNSFKASPNYKKLTYNIKR